jgi:hypothetical protein
MPEITAETPRDQITIAEETFFIPQPYAEGHVLTSNEAGALNQLFAENVRNNLASKVKAAKEADAFDHDTFQAEVVDDYTSKYEFGVRTGGGGRIGDPVQAEAIDIARDMVRDALRKKGYKLADVKAAQITELAKNVLAKGDATSEAIMTQARQRVEARRAIADIELDSLEVDGAGDGEEAGEAPAETSGKRSRKPAE